MFSVYKPSRRKTEYEKQLWILLFVASVLANVAIALNSPESEYQRALVMLFGLVVFFSSLSGLMLNWGITIPCGVIGLFLYGSCMAPVGTPDFSPVVGFVLGALFGLLLDLSTPPVTESNSSDKDGV